MKLTVFGIFLTAVAIILSLFGIQSLVKLIIGYLNRRIGKFLPELLRMAEDKKLDTKGLEEEVNNFQLLTLGKEGLSFITPIIGFMEMIFFGSLAVFADEASLLTTLLTSAGVWLGIKALGNYSQWHGSILGRNTFHIVLIGSIVNIALAVLIGLFVRAVIFNSC